MVTIEKQVKKLGLELKDVKKLLRAQTSKHNKLENKHNKLVDHTGSILEVLRETIETVYRIHPDA